MMIMIILSYIGIRNEILLVNNFLQSSDFISFKVVFHSKFPIFAYFLNIHKASPNTDHNIICMFLKRKTISKPENSSLRYTNQGKTTILLRANNGIQLVYPIVCNFSGIVLFKSSNICAKF